MIKDNLHKALEMVYEVLAQSRLAVWFFPKAVYRDMIVLGKNVKEYYVQKLTYMSGLFLLVIILCGFYLIQWFSGRNTRLESVNRPDVYEETQELVVQAGNQKNTYGLEIAPVVFTREEADQLLRELVNNLDTYILGQNESLDCVTENLHLPEYIAKYPFDIYWESDKEHIVDTLGTVNRKGLTEDEVVILTAVFQYEDWLWEEQFGILVCKEVLSEEEEYERQLGYLLTESEKRQRGKDSWVIPKTFQGEDLHVYALEKDYNLLILAGLVMAAAVAVWIGQDHDLHEDRQKRRTEFSQEYISFAESLSLYISAGLTLQAAMQYCIRDYIKRKPQGHMLRNALQEFQRNLQNGYSFAEAMKNFADKTDDIHYKRLAGILNQGIINGSQRLAEALMQEIEKIREEKRRLSKVKGEQVSTALIAPMMLQLGIVIALIMIPAFSNMQF